MWMPDFFPKGSKERLLFQLMCNVALAWIYGHFAIKFYHDFMDHGKISSAIFMLQETLLVFMFLTRTPAVDFSTSPQDWIWAILGTYPSMLVVPDGEEMLAFTVIQFIAMLWVTWGYFSLGRSISIVPAHRTLKRGGTYRIIRHPLYAGYILSLACVLINNPSLFNAGLIALTYVSLFARVLREEKFLLANNPDYLAYTQQTKYRLIPFVF
jgi:protein-S-isoprenylcysteine O-methyltransferase Ste14